MKLLPRPPSKALGNEELAAGALIMEVAADDAEVVAAPPFGPMIEDRPVAGDENLGRWGAVLIEPSAVVEACAADWDDWKRSPPPSRRIISNWRGEDRSKRISSLRTHFPRAFLPRNASAFAQNIDITRKRTIQPWFRDFSGVQRLLHLRRPGRGLGPCPPTFVSCRVPVGRESRSKASGERYVIHRTLLSVSISSIIFTLKVFLCQAWPVRAFQLLAHCDLKETH